MAETGYSNVVRKAKRIRVPEGFIFSDTHLAMSLTSVSEMNETLALTQEDIMMAGHAFLQATMVSMKEIFGWLCILGLFCLLMFLLKESTLRPKTLHPKFHTIRRTIKHQLKMDRLVAGR